MNKKILNFLPLACVLCLSAAVVSFEFSPANAQQPQPRTTVTPTPTPTASPTPEDDEGGTIVVDTDLVNLNVRVVDRNNRPVGNLRQQDFKVYEDNVLQTIDFFTRAEVPTDYALVIDNSGSLRQQLDKVIEASKIIVGTNRKDDETTVVRFVNSEKIEVVQDFTNNKSYINEALDNLFIEGGQTAIIDAVYLAAEKVSEHEKATDAGSKKRRALILVSDGEDRDSYYKEAQLFDLLRESDCRFTPSVLSMNYRKKAVSSAKVRRAKRKHFWRIWRRKPAEKFIFLHRFPS